MRHIKAKAWEQKLKRVFDEIDNVLEDEFGRKHDLHPARPERGATSSPSMDGLFNVGASFSAGYGSKFGPGYVVSIRVSTLERVSKELKLEVRDQVKTLLEEKLPAAFPGKELHVDRERDHLRIHGDLSLD